ncbi:MAG TPA: hypothetical protein VMT68_04525 [Caulobacteraceae bacterium]|nr:hypothetical protein [Caulobacteraceae bacterium]
MRTRSTVILAAAALAVGAGIGFGVGAQPNQPHMQNALSSLQSAASELKVALHNKGGHRVKALNLTNQAITEVQAGIAAGEGD